MWTLVAKALVMRLNAGSLGTFSLSWCLLQSWSSYSLIIQDFEKVFAITTSSLVQQLHVAFDLDSLNHDPVAMYLADLLTIPVNLSLPGISIPAGFAQRSSS